MQPRQEVEEGVGWLSFLGDVERGALASLEYVGYVCAK